MLIHYATYDAKISWNIIQGDVNIITTYQLLLGDHNDKRVQCVSYIYDYLIFMSYNMIKVEIVATALTIGTIVADIVAMAGIGVIIIAPMIIIVIANGNKIILCITNNTTALVVYSRSKQRKRLWCD